MPKKKLTKAQVKRKLKTAWLTLYDLYMDKFGYGPESYNPMSKKKAEEIYVALMQAKLRLNDRRQKHSDKCQRVSNGDVWQTVGCVASPNMCIVSIVWRKGDGDGLNALRAHP